MESLGWPTAEGLVTECTLSLAHKVLRTGEPHELADMFVRVHDTRSRSTRQDDNLYLLRTKSETGKRRFAHRAGVGLNHLPRNVTELNPVRFKTILKRHLPALLTGER